MSRKVISEQSSVHEKASYDEVNQTGHEPEEGHSWSSERDTLARFPDEDGDNYIGEGDEKEIDEGDVDGEGEVEGDEGMEGEGDENDMDERTLEVGSSGSPESGHARLFILPQMWIVNDFLSKMTTNIFKNLRDRFQIPDHIPIHLPRKLLLGEDGECWYIQRHIGSGAKAATDSITPPASQLPRPIRQPNRS